MRSCGIAGALPISTVLCRLPTGLVLTEARAINNRGSIVAKGQIDGADARLPTRSYRRQASQVALTLHDSAASRDAPRRMNDREPRITTTSHCHPQRSTCP